MNAKTGRKRKSDGSSNSTESSESTESRKSTEAVKEVIRGLVQASQKNTPSVDSSKAEELMRWLMSLDKAGGLVQYFDVLCVEFDADVKKNISCARMSDYDPKRSVLEAVDPAFFDIINCKKLGHRMLFAHGIARLKFPCRTDS